MTKCIVAELELDDFDDYDSEIIGHIRLLTW